MSDDDNTINVGGTFANMKPDGLYILLYKDNDDDVRFHWALYHFVNQQQGGWKFDILRPTGTWQPSIPYANTPSPAGIDDAYADGPLTCAVRLAFIDLTSATSSIHELITREDYRLSELNRSLEGGLNCKKYVKRACLRIPLPGFRGPESWDELEDEVLDLGERFRDRAGQQPVVVVDSAMSRAPMGEESDSGFEED